MEGFMSIEPVDLAAARAYAPLCHSESLLFPIRGLRLHVRRWRTSGQIRRRAIFLHGWMDSSASFQFVIDELGPGWEIHALDWRGFGLSERPASDTYWFPDYLADLEAVLDHVAPQGALDIVAHSMGGNAALLYAGIRPTRVRRVINLEGLGMRATRPRQAPERYLQWLDQTRKGHAMRPYPSVQALAQRLMSGNPRLRADRALFVASEWSRQRDDGLFEILGDPAHRGVNPVLYRVTEAIACWRKIEAEVLWVMSEFPGPNQQFALRPEYQRRLSAIRQLSRSTLSGAGHMMHHDQPAALARMIEDFLE